MNLVTDLAFVDREESWQAPDPVTNSPIWWNAIVYSLCLGVLFAFGWVLARKSWKAASKRDGATSDG